MGYTFDTKVKIPATVNTTTNANPATGTITIADDATLLVVGIIYGGNTGRTGGAPTANGTSLVQADAAKTVTEAVAELWYLTAPNPGANVIVVPNTPTAKNLDIFVASFKAQSGYSSVFSSASGSATTAANPNITLRVPDTQSVVVSVVGHGANAWGPTSQSGTVIYNEDPSTWGGGSQFILNPPIGAVISAWTQASDDYGLVVAAFSETLLPSIKTISDIGEGLDQLSETVSLSDSDTALGSDTNTELISLSLSDTSQAIESLLLNALKSICDFSIGVDDPNLLAWLTDECEPLLDDEGFPLIDDGIIGSDTYITILQEILKTITDIASAIDNLSIQAVLFTSEDANGQDLLSIQIAFSLGDVGAGVDSPSIAAALGITDGALGGDFLDLSASIPVSELGSGLDVLSQLLANLSLSDTGLGAELPNISANLSISDSGSGLDAVSLTTALLKSVADIGLGSDQLNISVSLSVADVGTGDEALAIQVSLQITDSGLGTETIALLTGTLKQIVDSASGSDNLVISASLNVGETSYGIDDPAIQASLGLSDIGEGLESPQISASLTITDTSAGTDLISVLQMTLKTIQEIATGNDTISSITVSIPVAESGLASDQIGQILASLLVSDLGSGVEAIVKFDTSTNILKIEFILNQPKMKFSMQNPQIETILVEPTTTTESVEPSISISLMQPVVKFSLKTQ